VPLKTLSNIRREVRAGGVTSKGARASGPMCSSGQRGYAKAVISRPHLNAQMVSLTSSLIIPADWLMAGQTIHDGWAPFVRTATARSTTAKTGAYETMSFRRSWGSWRETRPTMRPRSAESPHKKCRRRRWAREYQRCWSLGCECAVIALSHRSPERPARTSLVTQASASSSPVPRSALRRESSV
jgi:hypothetical protein